MLIHNCFKHRGLWFGVLAAAAVVGCASPRSAQAQDRIRLKDGSEFSGTVVRRAGPMLLVQVPRSDVEQINGQPLPPPVMPGAKAPAFKAVDLAGGAHQVPEQHSPVLLQFWASWCPYCRKDLAEMDRLAAAYGPGLRVLSISTDQEPEKLAAFLAENPRSYPVIVDGMRSAEEGSLAALYENSGVPAYFLIGGDGNILYAGSGSLVEQQNRQQQAGEAATPSDLDKAVRIALQRSGKSLPAPAEPAH